MKLHFIKLPLIFVTVLSIIAAGCLKDKAYENGEIQSVHTPGTTPKVIEIKLTAASQSNYLDFFIDNSPNDTVVDLIPVNLASVDPAPQDLHVTLVANDSLIDAYNAENGTDFEVPTKYTVINPGGVVIIPQGSHTGYLQIKFHIPDFLGTTNYAVGYTISKVDESGYTISGNNQNGIVAIGVKNKFDGLYSLRMKTIGWGAYDIADGLTFTWPSRVILKTAGPNSITLNTQETGSSAPGFDPSGGLAGFGATFTQFTFDPATNLMTDVKNLIPDDGRGRAFRLNPAVTDSRYDPDTKTIYAAYLFLQNGRPNMQYYDTLVYKSSR